ncbi:hypothetical protein EVAR_37549_1 [Eumeta japonica]|uniref:Uncharacterized protein n=1 Tax=Eumeta variegata TaxID=151549 RepID=A0A4C1XV40_EUMVA|nr:hypothetical protein EVAR_37549_1 [Eumeta japonica]
MENETVGRRYDRKQISPAPGRAERTPNPRRPPVTRVTYDEIPLLDTVLRTELDEKVHKDMYESSFKRVDGHHRLCTRKTPGKSLVCCRPFKKEYALFL